MKLLGTVLGFELGENMPDMKMDTESGPSAPKKEANTTSAKPTTTTTNKPTDQKNAAAAELPSVGRLTI